MMKRVLLTVYWCIATFCWVTFSDDGSHRATWTQSPGLPLPGGINNADYLYVFGPDGPQGAGHDDSVLINFYRVLATSNEPVTLFIFDPGSSGKLDRGNKSWTGSPVTTVYTVYGGDGCFTSPEAQHRRPTAMQPGELLLQSTYEKHHADSWVELGTVPLERGELVGDYRYFKLVVHAIRGSRCNYFRTAVQPWSAEGFSYHVSLLLDRPRGETLSFDIEVPGGLDEIYEHNFDLDHAGRAAIVTRQGRHDLVPSRSGQWTTNLIPVDNRPRAWSIRYDIVRGLQRRGNAAFFFTDSAGTPLKIFFGSRSHGHNLPLR